MLVYQLDPLEWTVEEVKNWIMEIFNTTEIGEKFKRQEIDGQTLLQSERILQDNSMEVLGLDTIGKKDKFTTSVAKLRGILASLLFDLSLMISFESEQIYSAAIKFPPFS